MHESKAMTYLEIEVHNKHVSRDMESFPPRLRKNLPDSVILMTGDSVFIHDNCAVSLNIVAREYDCRSGALCYYLGVMELDDTDNDEWYHSLINEGWVGAKNEWPTSISECLPHAPCDKSALS